MPHWNNQPWQRNLSKTASGKPGAVHHDLIFVSIKPAAAQNAIIPFEGTG